MCKMVLDRSWRIQFVNEHAKTLIASMRHFEVGANLWELFPDLREFHISQALRRGFCYAEAGFV